LDFRSKHIAGHGVQDSMRPQSGNSYTRQNFPVTGFCILSKYLCNLLKVYIEELHTTANHYFTLQHKAALHR